MKQNPPTIMFVGKSHSGKTTVAKLLAKKLKYTVIDTDSFSVFTKENYPDLIDYETNNRVYYDRESFTPFLKLLLQTTVFEYSLNNGFGVILSNGHLTNKIRTYNREVAKKLNSKSIIVYFQADDNLLRGRVKDSKRGTEMLTVSKSLDEMLEKQIKLFEEPEPIESDYFLKIDAANKIEVNAEIIIEYLKEIKLL